MGLATFQRTFAPPLSPLRSVGNAFALTFFSAFSASSAYSAFSVSCGEYRSRTDDLLRARQAL
jgi:hypothetical protein